MKTQLIMLDTPIIVSDEEIKHGEPCLVDGGLGRIGVDEFYSNVKYSVKPKKIIAGIEGLPSIDWNGLEEEFGWVDVEKLVSDYLELNHIEASDRRVKIVSELYRKAQSLNEKKFSLDDMEKMFDLGQKSMSDSDIPLDFKYHIQSLQQPKVFDIEVEMEYGWDSSPKITNNSIKIFKKL